LERLADTYLVEAAPADAKRRLEDAIRRAEELGFGGSDPRLPVLIRLKYKLALVSGLAGDLDAAKTQHSSANNDVAALEARGEKVTTTDVTKRLGAPVGKKSPFGLTKELAEAVLGWLGAQGNERARKLERLTGTLDVLPREVSRDELLLLLLVGERLLADSSITASTRVELAGFVTALSKIQPREAPVGGNGDPIDNMTPKLFERYAKLAAQQRSGQSG
jgi:hypothetical protein